MLHMRTFRLDQPSYLFFDITWTDLMIMGLGGAVSGFLATLLGWSPFAILGSMLAAGALSYFGKRIFLTIFPHGTHEDFWRWATQEAYFYCYAPDPVSIPPIVPSKGEE